jgi:hypothetical protein
MYRAIVIAVTLSACTVVEIPVREPLRDPPRPQLVGTGSGIVLELQDAILRECRFYPTANTVAAILNTVTVIENARIADTVCLAILQRQGDPSIPRVNGVVIRGRFVR